MENERLILREIPLDEMSLEEVFKDPDIVITLESPYKEIIGYTGRTLNEHIKRIEVIHRRVAPVDCDGAISLKVLASGLNIGYVRCRGCNRRLLVDWEELAVKPYIDHLERMHRSTVD